MRKHNHRGGRRAGRLAVLVGAGLACACVTQQEYDDAVALAKRYQTDVFTQENENARLAARVQTLEASLRNDQLQVLEGDFTGDVRNRMADLQAKLDELGRPLGDVERFQLDEGLLVMIQDKLLFESGKAVLGSDGIAALEGIAKEIVAQGARGKIYVRGHTDSDPVKKAETLARFPKGNIELSAARAVAVAAILIQTEPSLYVDIAVMGFGPHEQLVPNSSADNKRLNRRVEIFVANP